MHESIDECLVYIIKIDDLQDELLVLHMIGRYDHLHGL